MQKSPYARLTALVEQKSRCDGELARTRKQRKQVVVRPHLRIIGASGSIEAGHCRRRQ
jgi:hypothetical protein